ncbi:hypothetical protein NC653_017196 [Populus alba x Populus x berolinensis]|uniref:Uncharacterized protein n=1 Tax=Populus alba x Populus x berolinensis TaxID=444605 RepID=A0AAD6W0M5_9ROSI|nr:hypothetical protein NC653_017196 [Populus alba x Populus x berolinensis]
MMKMKLLLYLFLGCRMVLHEAKDCNFDRSAMRKHAQKGLFLGALPSLLLQWFLVPLTPMYFAILKAFREGLENPELLRSGPADGDDDPCVYLGNMFSVLVLGSHTSRFKSMSLNRYFASKPSTNLQNDSKKVRLQRNLNFTWSF